MAGRDITINIGAKNTASKVMVTVAKDSRLMAGKIQQASKIAAAALDSIGRAAQKIGGIFKSVGDSILGLGRKITIAGSAMSAAIAGAVVSFAAAGDKIQKMALRTGVTAEALSELAFAAEQSGSSIEVVEKGIRGMQRALFDAKRGSKEQVDALAELGLTSQQLEGQLPEDQFTMIADRLAAIKDPSLRAAIAMKVFGRAGTELLPLFSGSAKGIATLREEARELGRQLSGPDAEAAAALTDAINRLKSVFIGIKNEIGAALAPVLTGFLTSVTEVINKIRKWIAQNRDLAKVIAISAAGITALGVAVMALGGALSVLGSIVGGIGIGLAGLAVIGPMIMPMIPVVAAFAVKLSLVVAGVVAVGAAIVEAGRRLGIWSQALASLIPVLDSLKETASKTFQGIRDALNAGDLKLAAQIGIAGVKVAFLQGLADIGVAIANFLVRTGVSIVNFFMGFVTVAVNAMAAIRNAILNPMDALNSLEEFLDRRWIDLFTGGPDGDPKEGGIAAWMQSQLEESKKTLDELIAIAKKKAEDAAKEKAKGKDKEKAAEDEAIKDEVGKKIKVVGELQSVDSRLLTGTRGNPVLEEAKKQTKTLEKIAENTKPFSTNAEGVRPAPELESLKGEGLRFQKTSDKKFFSKTPTEINAFMESIRAGARKGGPLLASEKIGRKEEEKKADKRNADLMEEQKKQTELLQRMSQNIERGDSLRVEVVA